MKLMPIRRGGRPEVPVAPLIDCVFLLLIFYAVTAQFVSDQRLKLELPEAKTAEEAGAGADTKPPVVTVAADGSIWIDETEIAERDLEARLRQLIAKDKDQGLILKGDKGADYGTVIHVLDVARTVGATSIQMSASKPAADGPGSGH